MFFQQREITLILGRTGSGKTTAAKAYVQSSPRVFVVEAGFREFPVSQVETAEEVLAHLEERRAFGTAAPFSLGFTPLSDEEDWIFSVACRLGNLLLILDEADRFDPREHPAYDEVITRGRHWGVSIVAVGLHAYALPKSLRRQAGRIISYAQTEPSDVDALAELVGPRAYSLAPDEGGVSRLPDFSRLIWTPKTGARIVGPDGKDVGPTGMSPSAVCAPAAENTAPGGNPPSIVEPENKSIDK